MPADNRYTQLDNSTKGLTMLRISTEFGLMSALLFDAVEVNWLGLAGDEDITYVTDTQEAEAITVQLHCAEGGVVTAFTAYFDASEPGEASQMLSAAEQLAVQLGDTLVVANPALTLEKVLGDALFKKLGEPHLALKTL